jgi:hypothetical protein
MENKTGGPSIFRGMLIGYTIVSTVAAAYLTWKAIDIGQASAEKGFQFLSPAGALGAMLGYDITVRRRKSRGFSGPHDDWSRFFGSWLFCAMAAIVIAGSFVLAVLIMIAFGPLATPGG